MNEATPDDIVQVNFVTICNYVPMYIRRKEADHLMQSWFHERERLKRCSLLRRLWYYVRHWRQAGLIAGNNFYADGTIYCAGVVDMRYVVGIYLAAPSAQEKLVKIMEKTIDPDKDEPWKRGVGDEDY